MKKALIVRFLIVIAIVMSVCVVSATALLSSTEQNVRKSDMLTSLGLIRVIYEDEADHDYDLANRLSSLVGNARVSFINKDGTVFVDTYIDGEPDDNHSTREEIKQAELTGSGVAVRYSKTLGKNQIYAAMKVKDDDIIRISYNINSYMDFASMFIAPMLIAAAIGIIAGLIAVSSVARQIMKPINSISKAMSGMKYVGDEKISAELEEIPSHKYPELDEFVTMFNFMRKSIQDNMKTLENEREKERFILESLQDGVILYDNDLSVISINRAGLKLLGASDESGASTVPELARKPEIISGAEKAANEDRTVTIESTVDGRVLLVQVFPVSKSGIDAMHGGLMVIRDVTDKRMSEQLKADFFANAGHELKTPLTSVIGYADTLRSRTLPSEMQFEAANAIYTEGKRLERMSFALLDLFALERSEPSFSRVQTGALAASVQKSCEYRLARQKQSLQCDVEEAAVWGESELLRTLLLNLLDNAHKASPSGAVLQLRGRVVPSGYLFCVIDPGRGIPPEELSRITDPFYMVDKSRARAAGGAGLGLTLCRKIAEVHGSSLRFESVVGEGTRVSFLLKGEQK